MIDLHLHTTCSDGEFTPKETIQLAYQNGVKAVAITDHDTVSGIKEAKETADKLGMQFFSGIEISVQGEKELHILGYGVDPHNEQLLHFCKKNENSRRIRNEKILDYLRECDVNITLEDVRAYNKGRLSGRPHFAKALVALGYVPSIQQAFEKYLATPKFYEEVERQKPSPDEGIRIIREAGGVAVLAHPYILQLHDDALEKLIQKLCTLGLQGIEAYYSLHTPSQTKTYLRLANMYHLICTCGSDFHGASVKPDIEIGTGVQHNLCISDTQICVSLSKAIIDSSLSKFN